MSEIHLSPAEERAVRVALTDLPKVCRFHGADLERSGMRNGQPRCESCKVPWRARQAWAAFTTAADRRDRADNWRRAELDALEAEHGSVVHACPPGDESDTPCCRRLILELPRFHRLTEDASLVTCKGREVSDGE
ncbi:hypothetical protein ACIOD2_32250 [Amycolatopsis sp. NPDC088138]|uniref:hypothetical protein n=1 Tax=Amycolatopsis sp. NPDC088138 TaxID=3363938 RepID=UPI0038044A2D